jgi:hypothetical protein
MRVDIRTGGDGVACWNREAIHAFVAEVNEHEARLAERNPDLVIIPGQIKCYGCEAQEYDYGIKCTAQLTKTLYTVEGEVQPRVADAAGWHREVPDLQTIRPDDAPDEAAPAPNQTEMPARADPAGPVSPTPVREGGRRLFGRNR